jgi:acetyl esterase/lipase
MNKRAILDRPPPPADTRIAYGADGLQFGDLRLPSGEGPFPVVIVIHGGFWRAQYDLLHIGTLCAAFTAAGFATWNLEYRRVGHAGGGWPGTCQDVLTGAQFVAELARSYPLDLRHIVATGHSAGGHLVCWLAAEHQQLPFALRGVVPLGGVLDLREGARRNLGDGAIQDFLNGSTDYQLASPMERLPLGVPQIVIHGELDESVPLDLVQGFVAAAVAAGDHVELHALPHTGHFAPIDPSTHAWRTVRGAVESLL